MGAKRKKRIGGTVGTHAANAANIASLGWFVCQKVSASQNLAGSSFLSRLLIFYPPRFSTQEERGIAFLHLRFGRGRDSVLKFLRVGNPYRSGRLATNLSSIYSRPHTTYPPHHISFPYPICLRPSDIHRNRYPSIQDHLFCNYPSCLVLQKVVRPCFLALSSRQISYGQASSMRIWNSLE